jgi:uroporphyrin-III C-methyltransferase
MTVHLVGAGPGDPDLLTLRAARLLAKADVVVHDRLVSDQILSMVAPWAELIDVGKDPNGQRTSQERINQILVDRGRRHECVVRLKGGDPFVFGRGGEEAQALSDGGVGFAVTPGITSAIAGPTAAGVPVTNRGVSSAFTVVTAHQDPASDSLDWSALAALGSTLVVLMGARRAGSIRDRLIAEGMSADTPVAIITSATTPEQHVRSLVLSELGTLPVPNPSVIVLGEVAGERLVSLAARHLPPSRQSPHPSVPPTRPPTPGDVEGVSPWH